MPDQQTVPIPQGAQVQATVPIPPDASVLSGASQATSVGPAPGRAEQALENASDFAEDVTTGISKGAAKTVGGITDLIGEGLNHIPLIGEKLAPRAGLDAERKLLQAGTAEPASGSPQAVGEKVGNVLEEGGEWMAGDEALKGIASLAKVAKNSPHLIKIMEKYPAASKLLLDSVKGATLGGAQGAAKAPAEGKDVVESTAAGAAGGAVGSAVGAGSELATESKLSRGLINKSAGAVEKDVTYGNAAKAFLDENITSPRTGDLEAYKDALRAGKSLPEAAEAAGGRIAAVTGKINEYKPQLDAALHNSKVKIPVKDAIIDPIYDATSEIINNRAMTETENNAAVDKLLELQKSLLDGLGKQITPEMANTIKQQLGDRISWTGTSAVTDEVKPVYKSLYGALKQAVNDAVPEAAELNERMTNLLAAKQSLTKLARKEEVGAGRGVASGNIWDAPQRLLDELGRILPAAHAAAKNLAVKAGLGVAGTEAGKQMLPARSAGHIRFKSSDGAVHEVPADQLDAAKKIDPRLEVIEQD